MNLQLRPFVSSDASALFQLTDRNRNYLRLWLPWLDFVQQESDSLRFIESALKAEQAGLEQHRALMFQDDLVGTICLRALNTTHPNVGYWLDEALQGRGLMTQALQKMVAWANEQQIPQLVLRCRADNLGSAGVARKCGFQHVRTVARAENLYGRWVDLEEYILVLK